MANRLLRILLIGFISTILYCLQQHLHSIDADTITVDENTKDIKSSWTSPHSVDCKQLLSELKEPNNDDGIFKYTNTSTPFHMNIYNPSKDGVSKVIYETGCWECDHLKDMLAALSQYDKSYFLDIGGNIGMWSLTAAAAGYETYTIEALPANCKRFCKSVDRNDFYSTTNLMNIAATSEPETFKLSVPKGNIGGTRVIAVDSNNTDGEEVVKGVPIDTLNLPMNRQVVMKLDVEGHELQALLGAMSYLKNTNIVYAMMELRPNLHQNNQWEEIFSILTSKGLKPYRLDYGEETLLDVNRLHEWKHFKHPIVRYYDVAWRLDNFFRSG